MVYYFDLFFFNLFSRFPSKLAALKSLEVLDLSLNCIREVPTGIHGMQARK